MGVADGVGLAASVAAAVAIGDGDPDAVEVGPVVAAALAAILAPALAPALVHADAIKHVTARTARPWLPFIGLPPRNTERRSDDRATDPVTYLRYELQPTSTVRVKRSPCRYSITARLGNWLGMLVGLVPTM